MLNVVARAGTPMVIALHSVAVLVVAVSVISTSIKNAPRQTQYRGDYPIGSYSTDRLH